MNIEDLCFFDTETRRVRGAPIDDVTVVGAYRYCEHAFITILVYAIGTGPVTAVAVPHSAARLHWDDLPEDFRRHYSDAFADEAYFVAWNAAFDRLMWNGAHSDWPELRIDMTLDAMAQATAAGLPGKLDNAARLVGKTLKQSGKNLIALFEPPNGAEPADEPDHWQEFIDYAVDDINSMRDVWIHTRDLTLEEWKQYWASEEINDRGMMIDARLCATASVVADEARELYGERISDLTGQKVTEVTKVKALQEWVLAGNRAGRRQEALDILTKETEVRRKSDGELLRPVKYSVARENIEALLEYYDQCDDLTEDEELLVDVLLIREFGGSSTPAKFRKALTFAGKGRVLRGQYVFGGAAQTGRFSSRGVQTHNLTRKHHGDLEEEIIAVLCDLEDPRVDALLEETNT